MSAGARRVVFWLPVRINDLLLKEPPDPRGDRQSGVHLGSVKS